MKKNISAKWIAAMLIAVAIALAGCGGAETNENLQNGSEATETSTTPSDTAEASRPDAMPVPSLTPAPEAAVPPAQPDVPDGAEEHEHTYVKVNEVSPTCVSDGYAEYECSCGDTYRETLPALGHSFVNYISNNDATCTEDGTKTAVCEHPGCKETSTVADVGSAKGHRYSKEVTVQPTCSEKGAARYTCTSCGHSYTETLQALGHDFTHYVSNGDATCTEDGTKTAVCNHKGCHETHTVADVGSAKGHRYSKEVTKQPTCTEKGVAKYTCTSCGHSYTETLQALGHDFTHYVSNNDATCTEDGTKTAVCNHKGCRETSTITDVGSAKGHSFKVEIVPPCGDREGYSIYTCACGYSYKDCYVYSAIPDKMMDNSLLRALAYTGYDVNALKKAQLLYNLKYISGELEENRPEILSGIHYSDSGLGTVIRYDPVLGKNVPDIEKMKATGMSCTSFVEYYFLNYLRNVEGVKNGKLMTLHYEARMSFVYGTNRYGDLWTEICERAVREGCAAACYSGLSDSQNNTPAYQSIYNKIRIGTLIRFGNEDSPYIHYAIYAGTYNGRHYVIHVGNDRGPEITLVDYMGKEDSEIRSWPVAFYTFAFV